MADCIPGSIPLWFNKPGDFQMETRVNKKGQIVIPSILRKKYGIKEGTRIIFLEEEDSIVLKPITYRYIKKLQGSLKGTGILKALMAERHKDDFR